MVESLRVAASKGCAVGEVEADPDDPPPPAWLLLVGWAGGVGEAAIGEVGGGVVAPVMMVVGSTGSAPGTSRAEVEGPVVVDGC